MLAATFFENLEVLVSVGLGPLPSVLHTSREPTTPPQLLSLFSTSIFSVLCVLKRKGEALVFFKPLFIGWGPPSVSHLEHCHLSGLCIFRSTFFSFRYPLLKMGIRKGKEWGTRKLGSTEFTPFFATMWIINPDCRINPHF